MSRACAITLASEMTRGELHALKSIIQTKAFKGKHLEIGTAAGGTLCKMMEAATHRPPFVVVDTMRYFSNQRQTVINNLKQNGLSPENVDIRETTSADAWQTSQKQREAFDFILVDGAHKFRYVMQDLRWAGLLRSGGVLALHDYSSRLKDVQLAADLFLRRNPNFGKISLTDTLLLIEKKNSGDNDEVNLIPDSLAVLFQLFLQIRQSVRKRISPKN